MTLTLDAPSTHGMTLDAFVEHLEREIELRDVDGLIAAAPAFRALLNDRRLLADYVEGELRRWRDGTQGQDYLSSTIMMVERPAFSIRANLWPAPDPAKPAPKPTDPGFGYLIPHDHNFAFLTGAYRGPGYVTNLFEYDYDAVTGVVGAPVALRPLGRDDFPEGKMVLYRPSRDVHYQEHPAAFSISINVIVAEPYAQRLQYLFDLETQSVTAVFDTHGTRNAVLCEMAAAIADGTTLTLLGDVAMHAANAAVRVAAARAMSSLAPGDARAMLEQLRCDHDARVRALAGS